MSLPDKCPFCGASVLVMEDGKECRSGSWVTFGCFTMIGNGIDGRKFKSRTCEDAERARLSARLAELEAENKDLAARVAELERDLEQAKADRNRAAMDARNPLMARLAELEERCKRLEEVGDMIVAEYMVVEPEKSAWKQAKEAKP